MWRTWLVWLGEIDAGTARRVRQDFSISPQVDLSAPPTATLDVHEGRAVLRVRNDEDLVRFFESLDRRLEDRGSSIRALSFAPVEELRELDGKRLCHGLRTYAVSWEGARISYLSDPYARRFLRISKGEVAGATGAADEQIESSPLGLGAARLVLEPAELFLDDRQAKAAALFGTSGAEQGSFWFLPPVRGEDHPDRTGSYFAAGQAGLRQAIREIAGLERPSPDEPVAVHLQRLVDDPALRDLFLDGSSLRVRGEAGEATRIELEVWRGDTEIARARARVALGQQSFCAPWARTLADQLRRDTKSVLPTGAVHASASDQQVTWELPEAKMEETPTRMDGLWNVIDRLGLRLKGQGHVEEAHLLDDRVLRFARSGDEFGHHGAVTLFMKHCWRCPWLSAPNLDEGAWTVATTNLLLDEPFGTVRTPAERALPWSQAPAGPGGAIVTRVSTEERPVFMRYSGQPTDSQVLAWRLLLPLGSVVLAGILQLDRGQESILDASLVLG